MYPKLAEMVRLGYTKASFYGDEGEWTKGGHIVARNGVSGQVKTVHSERPNEEA
jgi:hypothetical protein